MSNIKISEDTFSRLTSNTEIVFKELGALELRRTFFIEAPLVSFKNGIKIEIQAVDNDLNGLSINSNELNFYSGSEEVVINGNDGAAAILCGVEKFSAGEGVKFTFLGNSSLQFSPEKNKKLFDFQNPVNLHKNMFHINDIESWSGDIRLPGLNNAFAVEWLKQNDIIDVKKEFVDLLKFDWQSEENVLIISGPNNPE